MKIRPSKCRLLQSSVQYLGHVISGKGIKTDLAKIACVANWPVPETTAELKRFLGFASYYRRFVRNFAQVTCPLNALTQQGAQWLWSEGFNNAFFELKKRLVSSPILALPDFSLDFVLDTDASGDGLGAVLSQVSNGEERVLAYASRALSRTERKYCATRREMLALVWAARHFRPYLYGKKFTLRTDHNSLKWLHNFKEPEGQVARWLEVLSEFDYTVVHRAGTTGEGQSPLETSIVQRPLQRVAMDILGPLPETPRDSRHTDQGKNFEAKIINEICALLDIRKTRTTAYHPQSDGLVERFNRTLLGAVEDLSQYAEILKRRMQQARERVLQYMELQQQRQKENYDDGVRGYAVIDFVFLHNPAIKRGHSEGGSLQPVKAGPCTGTCKGYTITEAVVLVPGQLAEPEEGLPVGPREPDGLEGDPPIQDPPNLAARDCNRDIPPPLTQVEPEDIQPVDIPTGPRRSARLRRPVVRYGDPVEIPETITDDDLFVRE
ncbi:hypothetical protein EMCRGX_G002170 [Ephydatia muelleri]